MLNIQKSCCRRRYIFVSPLVSYSFSSTITFIKADALPISHSVDATKDDADLG